MKPLFLLFAPPEKWRNANQSRRIEGEKWQRLRKKILDRDNFTCSYCNYRSEKYQIIDHIDGNPENNTYDNLQVICQMCNLIKHAGQGCVIKGVVDLYKESKYNQNAIIKITRKMRDEDAKDSEIIMVLGLKIKVPFKMDLVYLKKLFGFISSRLSNDNDDMYYKWLRYHNKHNKKWKTNKLEC